MASTSNATDVALLSVRTVFHGRIRDLYGLARTGFLGEIVWGCVAVRLEEYAWKLEG